MSENQYTPEERKQIASALKYAKRKLSHTGFDTKNNHICFALSDSVGANMARSIIMRRLGKAGSVTYWLGQKGLIKIYGYNKSLVQAYRHRWLNALIEEFSQ